MSGCSNLAGLPCLLCSETRMCKYQEHPIITSPGCTAPAAAAGRLVPAKLWAWQPGLMDSRLAPHASSVEVLAPLPRPDSCPLPQLARCSRLRVLRLAHVRARALPSLSNLTSLQSLEASSERHTTSSCALFAAVASACLLVQHCQTALRLSQQAALCSVRSPL